MFVEQKLSEEVDARKPRVGRNLSRKMALKEFLLKKKKFKNTITISETERQTEKQRDRGTSRERWLLRNSC